MSRRALLSALVVGAVSGSVLVAPSANAGVVPRLRGYLGVATQNGATHSLFVRGFAFDPAHPNAPVVVTVIADGQVVKRVRTVRVLPVINRTFHLRGAHGFRATVPMRRTVHNVVIRAHAAFNFYGVRNVAAGGVRQISPGAAIISWARRFVGRTPYVWGGASPRGFDCSGYAMYVYQHAGVALLPHSAQAQRFARGMHPIPRRLARPGDLIFYLSGGYAYHVAIFAGHGMDYAATQPGERIQYQPIWGQNLVFATNWH